MLAGLALQRATLLAARNRRPQPARDDKMLTGLNGLAVQAFARAGLLLKEPSFVTLAQTVADRIWLLAYSLEDRSLRHTIFRGRAHTDGFLQDCAQFGAAFMTLAEATGKTVWRDRAARLADDILRLFVRVDGSFAMSTDKKSLLIALTDEGDSEAPSGTSAAIELLLKLAAVSGSDPRYRLAARRAADHMSGALQQYPAVWVTTVASLNAYPLPPPEAVARTEEKADAPGAEPENFRIPVTADHVRVSAATQAATNDDRVIVIVIVDKGYHINANPASFDYLIPTSVRFERPQPSKVRYPEPVRFNAEFAPDGLDVYEGTVQVVAAFPKGALPRSDAIRGVVKVQACDDRICLPLLELPFSVTAENR
ncbi:MAG TPA: protein-disulfide reductase DsbD domain-containing protein [Burkholderiales bacterium]|nr:protein-disulfide reductase DsbD domain-containing protein [Burkholderiales bacterium]